jgi:succinate-acetate transporter protein
VIREQIWRHGRFWTAFVLGGPAGLLFGLFQLGSSDRLGRAILAGLSFGALFGAAMSILIWSRWKAAKKLSSQDRRAVARSVLKGEPIDDPRLAPAVIEYAAVVRQSQDRERRYRWTLWIWPILTLALAVATTVNGSTRQAVLFWALVVFWIAFIPSQQKRERKTSSAASRAESRARQLLDD